MHEVKTMCIHGIAVPFVYVGSVPNNRFSMLRISRNESTLIGFAARDAFDVGDESSLQVIHNVENTIVGIDRRSHCRIYRRCTILGTSA
ncbi:hypothetical protein NECAME_04868 [Necator americanus]|uniref:Uncharacterized protein n=1 Tax=Necator americanus TaxID=51031 RepID=W2SM20_NECAM|nr:hypothetical protein NECAME_04868 [Necator americanus]ETN70588.1 hypothetical protein NECAME_04868 [Necator americanus]